MSEKLKRPWCRFHLMTAVLMSIFDAAVAMVLMVLLAVFAD